MQNRKGRKEGAENRGDIFSLIFYMHTGPFYNA